VQLVVDVFHFVGLSQVGDELAASTTGRVNRSNGSASLVIRAISASMAAKSSSERLRPGMSTS
jgi:hypothetical protein